MENNLHNAYLEMRKACRANHPPEFFEYLFRLVFQSSFRGKEFQHLNSKTICQTFKNKAFYDFGENASLVLERWKVTTYQELGEAVHLLAQYGCFTLNPEDKIKEFIDVGAIHFN